LPEVASVRYKHGVARSHLLGMLPEDLVAHLAEANMALRPAEARRILAHAITLGQPGFPVARPVARRVTGAVAEAVDTNHLDVLERATDPGDGFVKLLLRSPDGALSEAVRIPLQRQGRFTVCLSSQVGCGLGCAFCATGRLGLRRSLAAWEMVSAFCRAREGADGRVTGAVFMGQGEPFANYEAVLRAAGILAHPCGGRIRAEAISISTAGLTPQIRRFTAERRPFRLVVSLTSALQEKRNALLPAMAAHPLDELARALAEHHAASGVRLTVAWVVLGGVNTGQDEVDALGRLLEGVPFQLDLIDVNDDRPGGFRRASAEELGAFRDRLRALGVPVVRRYAGGAGVRAACGMLASQWIGQRTATP
jgi:23S rRNA (adenine2503-C2)-methyltransferase